MNKSAFIYEIYILVYSRNDNTKIQYKYKETRYYINTQIKIKQMTSFPKKFQLNFNSMTKQIKFKIKQMTSQTVAA